MYVKTIRNSIIQISKKAYLDLRMNAEISKWKIIEYEGGNEKLIIK